MTIVHGGGKWKKNNLASLWSKHGFEQVTPKLLRSYSVITSFLSCARGKQSEVTESPLISMCLTIPKRWTWTNQFKQTESKQLFLYSYSVLREERGEISLLCHFLSSPFNSHLNTVSEKRDSVGGGDGINSVLLSTTTTKYYFGCAKVPKHGAQRRGERWDMSWGRDEG